MRTCLFLLFSMVSVYANGQALPDSIVKSVNRYNQKFPQEKVYVHTDRPNYEPGDTIWLKAYLVKANSHLVDLASKIIYIDFSKRDNGKLVRHLLLKNEGGFSQAFIALSDTMKEGNYEIRAYTNWMRNFQADYFFYKEIPVGKAYNAAKPKENEIAEHLTVADVAFFPEGGNLVAGLQNRVAFKAINKFGKGVDFKAFIMSSHNDTVTSIQSQHLGMGSFIFKPNPEETYYAGVNGPSGLTKFPLPESIAKGYTFFVDNMSHESQIKVIARSNFPTKDRPILIGQQRGQVVFAVASTGEGNSFIWNLPKENIKDVGVVQLTLFNAAGVPQCERLIYNDGDNLPIQISITPDKPEYQPNEKVVLSIHVQDQNEDPVEGNFSLSATDVVQVPPEQNGENIYTYLNLSSDVKPLKLEEVRGLIEQPGYYFDQANRNAKVHLDILLMSQGWRRFTWPDVLAQPIANPRFLVERAIAVKGSAALKNAKPLEKPLDITLSYALTKDTTVTLKTATDLSGRFAFPGLDINNETEFLLESIKEKGTRNVTLHYAMPELPKDKPRQGLVDPFLFSTAIAEITLQQKAHLAELDAQQKMANSKILKELVIKAKREQARPDDSRRKFYSGLNVKSLPVDSHLCSGSYYVMQMLQGQFSGLSIDPDPSGQGTYIATITRKKSMTMINGGSNAYPALLVDGVVVDMTYLNTLSPCSIESIEVVTQQVSVLNAPGIISFLTKGGSNAYRDWSPTSALESDPTALAIKVQGYETAREFYSPKYLVKESIKPFPDFRSTLYWNPTIKTDEDGNATVTFWNSDETTSIRVNLEGISNTGRAGFAHATYDVK